MCVKILRYYKDFLSDHSALVYAVRCRYEICISIGGTQWVMHSLHRLRFTRAAGVQDLQAD